MSPINGKKSGLSWQRYTQSKPIRHIEERLASTFRGLCGQDMSGQAADKTDKKHPATCPQCIVIKKKRTEQAKETREVNKKLRDMYPPDSSIFQDEPKSDQFRKKADEVFVREQEKIAHERWVGELARARNQMKKYGDDADGELAAIIAKLEAMSGDTAAKVKWLDGKLEMVLEDVHSEPKFTPAQLKRQNAVARQAQLIKKKADRLMKQYGKGLLSNTGYAEAVLGLAVHGGSDRQHEDMRARAANLIRDANEHIAMPEKYRMKVDEALRLLGYEPVPEPELETVETL